MQLQGKSSTGVYQSLAGLGELSAVGFVALGFGCVIAGGEQHRGAPEPGRPGGSCLL